MSVFAPKKQVKSQLKKVKSQTVFTIKTFIKLHYTAVFLGESEEVTERSLPSESCAIAHRRSTTNSFCGAIGCNRENDKRVLAPVESRDSDTPPPVLLKMVRSRGRGEGIWITDRNISDLDFPGNP